MTGTTVLEPTKSTPVAARTALGLRATQFVTPVEVMDADTHEGLRAALGLIVDAGWDCEAARAVLAALDSRTQSWAAQRARTCRASVDPGDVLSFGWSTLATFPSQVIASQAPWAYLWASVQKRLGSSIAADILLSEKTTRWPRDEWPTILRSGVHSLGLPDEKNIDPALLLEAENATTCAVEALVAHLAGGLAAEAVFWTEAVTRALHIMESARRSYEEVELRKDAYMRNVLRLSLNELAALAALLIGPRRGDREAHSLLLALRHDPDTCPADVEGARARIRLLRQRRHVVTAARYAAVAA